MRLILRTALIAGGLAVSGCATMTETERAFVGGGVGLALAGPFGASPAVGATVGAGIGLFADNILGF